MTRARTPKRLLAFSRWPQSSPRATCLVHSQKVTACTLAEIRYVDYSALRLSATLMAD
jgi:hypothetical protein